MEVEGEQRMNREQRAAFLDRTNGRVRRRRKHGAESQERRKETPFFILILFPKFASQLPPQRGFWNHFHHSEGTPAQGLCRSVHHSFCMLSTLIVLTIKTESLWAEKRSGLEISELKRTK